VGHSRADLKAAIEELIERIGPAMSAVSRILSGAPCGGAKAAFVATLAGRGGGIQKFYDLSENGPDDGDDFDWRSYGRSRLHGHFDPADRKVAELWRGTIARVPSLVNDAWLRQLGRGDDQEYRLSAPMARGVIGYVVGSFARIQIAAPWGFTPDFQQGAAFGRRSGLFSGRRPGGTKPIQPGHHHRRGSLRTGSRCRSDRR
jgi:hypothetical protein